MDGERDRAVVPRTQQKAVEQFFYRAQLPFSEIDAGTACPLGFCGDADHFIEGAVAKDDECRQNFRRACDRERFIRIFFVKKTVGREFYNAFGTAFGVLCIGAACRRNRDTVCKEQQDDGDRQQKL